MTCDIDCTLADEFFEASYLCNTGTIMALVRCEGHGKPKGRTREYVVGKRPIGYPDTAAICGLANCKSPGLIWLDKYEHQAYQEGQRIFEVASAEVKVRAE